jgi:hypothetical protein
MRVIRAFSMVVLALILASATTPAWAGPPTVLTAHTYSIGAGAAYQLPTGAWGINFGIARSSQDGPATEQRSVAVFIFENSCSPDGLTCNAYALDGTAVVADEAITIPPTLDTAVLTPVEVTTSGEACTSWFDDTLGDWVGECHQITQTTTVSATLTATGPADLSLDHENLRSDEPFFRARYTATFGVHSRPAAATVSAFGRTSSDPTSELTGARIARELDVGNLVSWQPES